MVQGKFGQEGEQYAPKPCIFGLEVHDAGIYFEGGGAKRYVMVRNENEMVWVFGEVV